MCEWEWNHEIVRPRPSRRLGPHFRPIPMCVVVFQTEGAPHPPSRHLPAASSSRTKATSSSTASPRAYLLRDSLECRGRPAPAGPRPFTALVHSASCAFRSSGDANRRWAGTTSRVAVGPADRSADRPSGIERASKACNLTACGGPCRWVSYVRAVDLGESEPAPITLCARPLESARYLSC
jgi:hypothetical protein